MKMRKITCVLTAVVAVFAFCMTANAQDICTNCEKCEAGSVPCPGTEVGPQGQVTVTDACPFDYDGERYEAVSGSWGYVTGYNWDATENPRNCKLLFDICECPDSCVFEAGQQIGIRMVITTPGVYWAGPEMDTIYFDMFTNAEFANGTACAADTMRQANVYDGSGIGLTGDNVIRTEVRNFGEITYYQQYTEAVNSQGTITGTVNYPGVPLAGCSNFNISSQNSTYAATDHDVIALESTLDTDYMITMDDTETGQCHLWIDIPPMRIDGTAEQCAPINVRIMLLYDRRNTGLCEDCHPPIICECTRTVGYVCCEDGEDPTTQQCIYFPYVTVNSDGWFTGIGITNLDTDVDSPQLTFTLTDSAGTSYIANPISFTNTTQAWSVQGLIDELTWNGNPANAPAGAGWLRVQGNFQLDGFQFVVSEGLSFGAATLPRRACDGCGGCPVVAGE